MFTRRTQENQAHVTRSLSSWDFVRPQFRTTKTLKQRKRPPRRQKGGPTTGPSCGLRNEHFGIVCRSMPRRQLRARQHDALLSCVAMRERPPVWATDRHEDKPVAGRRLLPGERLRYCGISLRQNESKQEAIRRSLKHSPSASAVLSCHLSGPPLPSSLHCLPIRLAPADRRVLVTGNGQNVADSRQGVVGPLTRD